MELIVTIFNESLSRPLYNLLVWTYNIIPGHDFGVAIILVTVFLRVVLYPLSDKALRSQKALQNLQPKIKEIQKKLKNKEEQARTMMQFYKEHKINPFSGCLPLLIQLPILIALYRVFLTGLEPNSLNSLYSFVENPGELNPMFFGVMNLAQPSHILAVLAGLSQFLQAKSAFPKTSGAPQGAGPDFSKSMQQSMIYMMPLFMVFIAWSFPAGLALYWVVTMLFSFGQQIIVNRAVDKKS
ncbi:MAG: YidC/Oxa1 family membrane protein insertase [Candidatus Spechtbacterales bacterium]